MEEFASDAASSDAGVDVMHVGATFSHKSSISLMNVPSSRGMRLPAYLGQCRGFDTGMDDLCLDQIERALKSAQNFSLPVCSAADPTGRGA